MVPRRPMPRWKRKLLRWFRNRVRPLSERTPYALLPRTINLEITRTCNLLCPMCARQRDLPPKRDLTAEEASHILGQLPTLRLINIVGFGEPLASPNLFGILDAAEASDAKVTMTTNATLLDESHVARLPRCVSHMYVSVDSPSPEKYEQIRPGARFHEVQANIGALRRLRPDIRLGIQGVITRETVQDAAALVRFAAGVGAQGVSFLHIDPVGEENCRQHVLGEPGAERPLQEAREAGAQLGLDVTAPDAAPRLRPCRAPWREPHISADGTLRACCFMNRSPGRATEWLLGDPLPLPQEQYVVGNVLRDSFRAIWNSAPLRRARRSVRRAERERGVSLQDLRRRRTDANLAPRFAYCAVCLWRWGCAC